MSALTNSVSDSVSHFFDTQTAKVYHDDGTVFQVGSPDHHLDYYAAIERITSYLIKAEIIKPNDTLWSMH